MQKIRPLSCLSGTTGWGKEIEAQSLHLLITLKSDLCVFYVILKNARLFVNIPHFLRIYLYTGRAESETIGSVGYGSGEPALPWN